VFVGQSLGANRRGAMNIWTYAEMPECPEILLGLLPKEPNKEEME